MGMRATLLGCVIGLCAVAFVPAGAALAQDSGAGLKIGYVDVPRALKGTKAAEAAIAQLKTEFEKKRAELEAKARAIESAEREIETQSAALNEEALKEKKRQVEDMRREAARYQADAREDMGKREAAIIQDQMKELLVAVREVSSAGGYDVVYQVSRERLEEAGLLSSEEARPIFDPGAGLIYAKPEFDITTEVIERMNAQGS